MLTNKFKISPYSNTHKEQVLKVWEASVLSTHNFLTPKDFEEIKELVNNINFNDFEVFCLTDDTLVVGFIGVADRKIEMLFLDPNYFGQGLGFQLVDFAVKTLKADKVDVNEQNLKAIQFYKKYGFETFERTDKADQGRHYPLLRMKLF